MKRMNVTEILILKTNKNRGLPTAVRSRREQRRVRRPLGFGTVSSDSTATAPRGSPARSTDRHRHTHADSALKLHRWESRNHHSSSSCYVKRPQAHPPHGRPCCRQALLHARWLLNVLAAALTKASAYICRRKLSFLIVHKNEYL